MKIIAQKNNEIFLILSRNNKDPSKRKGFIVDTLKEIIFPEQLMEALIKFGYWEDYVGSQDLIKEFKKYKKQK